ncbi:MAG: arginine--tRNA ligase [Acidimicrobiia bacterium]
MSLLSDLGDRFGAAFEALGFEPELGEVVRSQRPELGQFQCNGALAAGNRAGRDPRDIAQEVIDLMDDHAILAELEVAGPGFINLSVSDDHLRERLATLAADERFGVPIVDKPKRVLIDYGGPNISKALHVGHLRSTIIGDSLLRLFRFAGHPAVGDIHIGDWGTPMGMLIIELERRSPDLPYFDRSFEGPYPEDSPITIEELGMLYPAAAARAESDPEIAERARAATKDLQQGRPGYLALWQHLSDVSRASHEADFAALGVKFDLWYGESTVRGRIEDLISEIEESGAADHSDGALIVAVSEPDDRKEIPPLMLMRSDGGYLYSTTDLATIQMRAAELGFELALYVVDARQALHFEQLFRAARKTGVAPPSLVLEHVPFGTVNGPDGKPFRTREGGVVLLSDVIEMVQEAAAGRLEEAELAREYPPAEQAEIARRVGLAALKFGDLINHRTSNYTFDLDRFASFEGKTGPYLQYGAVRMRSILRKASERGFDAGPVTAAAHPSERELVLLLLLAPETVARSIDARAPNHVAEFAYEVTTQFNRFYDHCHVLREEDLDQRGSWLTLVAATLRNLELLLELLGIEVPNRM